MDPISNHTTRSADFTRELKFLVPHATADQVLAWARSHLQPDPHANGVLADGYIVQGLYFDTAAFDVFHKKGSFGRAKYRLRRYGLEEGMFLERKLKADGRVLKRRTRVSLDQLDGLRGEATPDGWPGAWFHRRILARALEPKCVISYTRVARIAATLEGPVRLTVDREVRCTAAPGLLIPHVPEGARLLDGMSIVELKYRETMPSLFKGLVADLKLEPQPVSKYRLAIQACDLVPPSAAASAVATA